MIYKYSRNIDYKYYITILNYIFEDSPIIDNEQFVNKLYKITLLDKSQLNAKLKTLLADKYKSLEGVVPFLSQDNYNYDHLLYNEDLYHIILATPNIITIKYNYIYNENKYIYYGYQNIDSIVNKFINDKKDKKDKEGKEDKEDKKDKKDKEDKEFDGEYATNIWNVGVATAFDT